MNNRNQIPIKSYQTGKDLKNPFFKNKQKNFNRILLILTAIAIVGGTIWLIFDSPASRMQRIHVNGAITLDNNKIADSIKDHLEQRRGFLPSLSILRRYRNNIDEYIIGEFDNIEVANFRRENRGINLDIKEYPYGIILHEKNIWYLKTDNQRLQLSEEELDEIADRINNIKPDKYLIHPDTPILEMENQNQTFRPPHTSQYIQQLIQLNNKLDKYNFNISLFRKDPDASSWVKAIGMTDVPVYIELFTDHQLQLSSLREYLNNAKSHQEYIDIRFSPRIYIK